MKTNNELHIFLDKNMVSIEGGSETIRRFRDEKKWISSNYRMSIPSSGHHQKQTAEEVRIESFQMARYPVTNDLYNRIMGVSEEYSGQTADSSLSPRVNISWYEAIRFCNRLSRYYGLNEYYSLEDDTAEVVCLNGADGFRLPTDAEWQYACKAGSGSYQYSDIDDIAWHKDNSDNGIHDIGLKKPNGWGLYDMLGNIWEWCWDLYNPETYKSYRIFRGGSFAEEPRVCGATTRRKSHPDYAIDDVGFRVARSI